MRGDKNIENYYFRFQTFIQISPLLNEFYLAEMMTNFLTSTISIASSKIRQYLRKTMKDIKDYKKNSQKIEYAKYFRSEQYLQFSRYDKSV